MIVVSHDRYFTDKVVDHLLVFQGNAVIKDFPGNYSDYREWKEQQDAIDAKQAEIKQKNKVEEPKRSVNRTRKLSFAEQREYSLLESDIENLETEKKDLETMLSGGNIPQQELIKASERIAEVIELIDDKTMRWLELSEYTNN